MGMFDTIKCSYDIGELTDVECQSKNIDDWGGTMSFYWVDPNGRLWSPRYDGTYDFVPTESPFFPELGKGNLSHVKYLGTKPNGNHGKYQFVSMTRCIEIYRCDSQADGYSECSVAFLEFYRGQLKDYSYK